jgi:hypothetical protein
MTPTPKELSEAVGISPSYASMILSESDDPSSSRTPPKPLAILIYRRTGWKHSAIFDLTEQQMAVIEEVDPWTPKRQAA